MYILFLIKTHFSKYIYVNKNKWMLAKKNNNKNNKIFLLINPQEIQKTQRIHKLI